MRHNIFIAASAVALSFIGFTPSDADGYTPSSKPSAIVEVAGADDSGSASPEELEKSGTNMVPAAESAPSRDPLATEPKTVPTTSASEKTVNTATELENAAPTTTANQQPAPPTETEPQKVPSEEATAESALSGYYFRIDGGYLISGDPDGSGRNGTNTNTDIDNTGVLSIGLGMPVDTNMRADITASYRPSMSISGRDGSGNTVGSDVDSYDAFLNLYYDFNQVHDIFGNSFFTPYVGAGIGMSALSSDTLTTTGGPSEEGTTVFNLTYAAMAGIAAALTENIDLDIGYRFVNLGEFEHDGKFSTGISAAATKYDSLFAHEFRAGLRFNF